MEEAHGTPTPPYPPHAHEYDHAGPSLQTYLVVFYVLCGFTLLSFVVNYFVGQNALSAGIILGIAVIKAALVIAIFMHLKFDWSRLYGIIIPVSILGVMMIIILSIDTVAAWHHYWFAS